MNYLAHLWLTEHAGLPLAGAVLGDMVHGRLDGRFPGELERSIRLHRRVDVVTDAHPVVTAARTRFGPGARRYAGIVLDLVYDHCLARDWERYHALSLAEFARAAAAAVCAEREGFALAGRSAPATWRLHRLLRSYAGTRGIDFALHRTAHWLKKPEGLIEAGRDWREHAAAAAEELPRLLQDLRVEAQRFAAQ